MGGNAFARSDITVTRIDDQLHRQSAATFQVIFERFYNQVLLPPSAPGKEDHGDIDFLVSEAKARQGGEKLRGEIGEEVVGIEEAVGQELGAVAVYRNNAMTSYAIPHPQQSNLHIQLDTHLRDPTYLPWILFLTSYGDLVPILGSIHHRLGLIINDKGFWVQLDLPKGANECGIPKPEMVVFMTLDPERMMEFMGLDAERYRTGFEDEEQVFHWIREGRFFRRIAKRTTVTATSPEAADDEARVKGDSAEGAETTETSPSQVALEAATFFDKRKQYDTQLQHCLAQVQDFNFWQQVRSALPGSSSRRARIIKSLKKWVRAEGGEMRVSEEPMDRSPLSVGTEDELAGRLKWIVEHWEGVYVKEKGATENARGSTA
ncbi:hypothetical protein QFC20_005254 [Naganishia adeliensis]|uniref:Uncharacterized protein n=1 Tax=Naganishia adeliensis TaxID=92952 RepID=A0ACC2VQI4_9TREE|nr:hypothetical protein QFC20_005254 [Naganishia adeliensis]